MSRILRRPMFRGGRASSYGTGIASGLANGGMPNKRGLVDGPGGYAGLAEEVLSTREEILKGIPAQRGLSTSDYLRIASAGLDILGAPSEGGGIKGVLATASKPLSKLGTDIAGSLDKRGQSREDLATSLTGAGLEYKIGMEKAKGVLGFKEKLINNLFDKDIELAIANGDEESVRSLQQEKEDYIDKYIIRGIDDSDILALLRNQTAFDQAEGDARRIVANTINPKTKEKWKTTDLGYTKLKNKKKLEILSETSKFNVEVETKAEGGLTGTMTEDVNVMEQTPGGIADVNIQETETMDPNNPQPMQVSYDELRARLPKEIGDDIVTLLANSYEALADFAAISTQADVDNFNVKYGVELVLPQEA